MATRQCYINEDLGRGAQMGHRAFVMQIYTAGHHILQLHFTYNADQRFHIAYITSWVTDMLAMSSKIFNIRLSIICVWFQS